MMIGEISSKSPNSLLVDWLRDEYGYSSRKFGDNQSSDLAVYSISNNAVFAGQAATYWARMQAFRRGNADMQAAQAAAKVTSSLRSLWSSIRSIDRQNDREAAADAINLIDLHFFDDAPHAGKSIIDIDDFWETPMGLGSTYLERHIRNHGLSRKFRLGQLVRAEQIMVDSADVAALQFERTLEVTGNLPEPGFPSGEIHLWLPDSS